MIEELERFLLVVQEGNLTKSAEKIFITQSALTQSIQRLEKKLNTKLFQQKGKQLHLTEDGKSLVILGDKILQLWTNAQNPKIRKIQTPLYSLGMFDNVALRLSKFFQSKLQNEEYNLELIIDSSSKLLAQLQLGTLDAALCVFGKTYHLPSHLTLLKTFTEKLLPVAAQTFSNKILDIPFILYNRGSHTRGQIDEVFAMHGIQPKVFAESTSVTFMRELALLGSGVALLPENFVKEDLDQGRLKKQKMPIHWQRTYGLFVQNQYNLQTPYLMDLQEALSNLNNK